MLEQDQEESLLVVVWRLLFCTYGMLCLGVVRVWEPRDGRHFVGPFLRVADVSDGY